MKAATAADRVSSSSDVVISRPLLVEVCVQTYVPLMKDKWVMTDPLPPVENYKERYDRIMKEKKDLHTKLERSEDQKYKMQRDHKREVEKLQKQYRQEAREVGGECIINSRILNCLSSCMLTHAHRSTPTPTSKFHMHSHTCSQTHLTINVWPCSLSPLYLCLVLLCCRRCKVVFVSLKRRLLRRGARDNRKRRSKGIKYAP